MYIVEVDKWNSTVWVLHLGPMSEDREWIELYSSDGYLFDGPVFKKKKHYNGEKWFLDMYGHPEGLCWWEISKEEYEAFSFLEAHVILEELGCI